LFINNYLASLALSLKPKTSESFQGPAPAAKEFENYDLVHPTPLLFDVDRNPADSAFSERANGKTGVAIGVGESSERGEERGQSHGVNSRQRRDAQAGGGKF
jgi:hypothetical protein